MKGLRPYQPQYFIRLHKPKFMGASDYIDVENYVADGVSYSEQADLVNMLNFTVDKNADVLLPSVFLGMRVTFKAGVYSDTGLSVEDVFDGSVTRIYTQFPDDGVMSFTLECMSHSFVKSAKDIRYNEYYPNEESKRSFASGKTSITAEELIRGIAEECNIQVGEIKLAKNTEYTYDSPINQKSSDWAFLSRLAKLHNASIWTETSANTDLLYVIDKGSMDGIKKDRNSINFVYPLKGIYNKIEGAKDVSVRTIAENEMIKYGDSFWHRPRVIWGVSVEEDIASATSLSRSAIRFNDDTGQYEESLAKVEEVDGKRNIVFYSLDESRVEYIDRTNPDLADRIRNNSPFALEWRKPGRPDNEPETDPNFAAYYYVATTAPMDEMTAVFDRAFFGITIRATTIGDINIRSQRYYDVRGILRYSTNDTTAKYYLMSVTHTWGSDGFTTEMELKR